LLLSALLQKAASVRSMDLSGFVAGLLLSEADAWHMHRLRAVFVRRLLPQALAGVPAADVV